MKLYNREMDTAKWVSSGTTYLLRNGQNTVNMSLIKLKECVYVFQVFWLCIVLLRIFVAFLYLKVAVMSQRSGHFFPFYTPTDPKLHPHRKSTLRYSCNAPQNRILTIARSRSFNPTFSFNRQLWSSINIDK